MPALRLTSQRLLSPARGIQPVRSSRALDAFVALQVALSLPLIVGASLFSMSLWHARQVDFGLDATNVVVLTMNHDEVGTPAENHAAHRRIQERLAQLPHVSAATLVQNASMNTIMAMGVVPPGTPFHGRAPHVHGVGSSFFEVMGLRFAAGRPFTALENSAGAPPVIVINETMADIFWPGEPAVGRCLILPARDKRCSEVVGVVANAAQWPTLVEPRDVPAACYIPIEQWLDLTASRGVLVRTNTAPEDVMSLLRKEAQATGTNLPYIDVWALDDVFQPALRPLRLGAQVFVAFGILALLIAAVGLAAVTAYGITRRRRELAIRSALGAEPRALVRLVLRHSLLATLAGLAAGGALALGASRWLTSLLFGVSPTNVGVYLTATGLLLVTGAAAAYLPARRAGRIDPAVALRAE